MTSPKFEIKIRHLLICRMLAYRHKAALGLLFLSGMLALVLLILFSKKEIETNNWMVESSEGRMRSHAQQPIISACLHVIFCWFYGKQVFWHEEFWFSQTARGTHGVSMLIIMSSISGTFITSLVWSMQWAGARSELPSGFGFPGPTPLSWWMMGISFACGFCLFLLALHVIFLGYELYSLGACTCNCSCCSISFTKEYLLTRCRSCLTFTKELLLTDAGNLEEEEQLKNLNQDPAHTYMAFHESREDSSATT